MNTDWQIVSLPGFALGFLYWNTTMEEDYEEGEDFVERYQFVFFIFAIICTRWEDQF
tara:strand:+ start:1479 stop:1649 length:171 start_codon:yes stop_codon:yes gene_type:complete